MLNDVERQTIYACNTENGCKRLYLFDLQGYAPGLIGVSHGALQFMAYEELKKGYSQYFGTPINKKLVN